MQMFPLLNLFDKKEGKNEEKLSKYSDILSTF